MHLEAVEADEDVNETCVGKVRSTRQCVELRVERHVFAARRAPGPVPLLDRFGVASETMSLADEFPRSVWSFQTSLGLRRERLRNQFEVGKRLTRHEQIVPVSGRPRAADASDEFAAEAARSAPLRRSRRQGRGVDR